MSLQIIAPYAPLYCKPCPEAERDDEIWFGQGVEVLEELGRPVPEIDLRLEHILITGMFRTFFELIIHAMPLPEAENYLREMRTFYTAGWMKIMGQ